MPPPQRLRLNTYSDLFQPDRRIHAIDGHRIPVPGGVPIAVVGYTAFLAALTALLSALPGLGELLGLIHPAIRWVIIPLAGAILIHQQRIDGRSPAAVLAGRATRLSSSPRLGRPRPSEKRRRHRAAIRPRRSRR